MSPASVRMQVSNSIGGWGITHVDAVHMQPLVEQAHLLMLESDLHLYRACWRR